MKLYVGSRSYKPDGFMTVDIDDSYSPDIVADITKMPEISDSSVDEIVAGHVLEHIDWPDSFLAISEFSRVLKVGGVLKISIPDMTAMMRMILSGDNVFHVMGLIYGVGGRENKFEQHRYGFTVGMLVDILTSLGFGDFDWWNSSFGDASNGWVPQQENRHSAMSLNISAVKSGISLVDSSKIYQVLIREPLCDYNSLVAEFVSREPFENIPDYSKIYQRIHFQLIEARQRIMHLEGEIDRKERKEA